MQVFRNTRMEDGYSKVREPGKGCPLPARVACALESYHEVEAYLAVFRDPPVH